MIKNERFSNYKARIDTALNNKFLRTAMDNFAIAYKKSRSSAFSEMDVKSAIEKIADIKSHAIQNSERLISQFISNAEKKGVIIHQAATADDANKIISKIVQQTDSKHIVKSKSMTAEEIQLNQHLESKGYEVTETDLGEWIVQLREEGPSHMVMPAIHLSRHQVADLFSGVTQKNQSPDIQKLVKIARQHLRKKYVEADIGITGANYVIADTGSIGIVTNEGNARLVSTLPRVHIALCGIDKLLPSIEDALTVNQILPKNATGQSITSYVTWITGPSECKAAPGNKRQMHIILLDNGRKRIAADPIFSQVLQCIRCGACANVCPVYRMVGGHQLGYVYIGAIGLITTYFFHGRKNAANLVKNCINCGACKEVCAGGIDLPKLIKEVHAKIQDETGHPLESVLLGKILKNRALFHTLLKTASFIQKPVEDKSAHLRHLPMIFSKEHNFRILPAIKEKSFRDRFRHLNRRFSNPRLKIALFSGCMQDFVYPEHLESALTLFQALNIQVEFPEKQTCCGLPALMMGEKNSARDVALQNIKAFDSHNVDYIVTLCASCASHLKNHVPDLLKKDESTAGRLFADKIIIFSQLINILGGSETIKNSYLHKKVALHLPCHLSKGLGIKDDPKKLITLSGNSYVPTEEEETCCGFGGSFSVNFPSISKEILKKKLSDLEKSGAGLLVTECPGCVMQLRGGVLKHNKNIEVKHLSEILKPKA